MWVDRWLHLARSAVAVIRTCLRMERRTYGIRACRRPQVFASIRSASNSACGTSVEEVRSNSSILD